MYRNKNKPILLKKYFFYFLFLLSIQLNYAQDIELFQQFNGRYDFTFIGNTMNPAENTNNFPTFLYTSSSATLTLQTDDTVLAAYLYWAGSGTGDTEIKLNDVAITPDILYNITGTFSNLDYFSAYTDITTQIQNTGNGTYTVSDFDLNDLVPLYDDNGTQFAAWAILVIYENPSLTLNQINVYQGLEALSPIPSQGFIDSKTIQLDNLYLASNTDAKIGFIAWEGDSGISYEESLKLTTNATYTLSNSLNPPNNAFNGTSTEENSNTHYNMDIDVYSIENYVQPGLTSAEVTLQSGQDYVMLNTIVTKLNSQLPDATVTIDEYSNSCDAETMTINFTVYNVNSTEILPENTTVDFYIGTTLVGTTTTQNDIPIGGNETGVVTIAIPTGIPENLTVTAVVDGGNLVDEINEDNNTFEIAITRWLSPTLPELPELLACNIGFTTAYFNLNAYVLELNLDSSLNVSLHQTLNEAENGTNAILNLENFESNLVTNEVYIRFENEWGCYSIGTIILNIENCPPTIYNAVSANGDGANDGFFIDGLRDIFVNFKIDIYNRWGKHIWTGDNSKPDWDGYIKNGIIHKKAPTGIYFYVLYLNDSNYPKAYSGYLYLIN